jgi:hypothetical protein
MHDTWPDRQLRDRRHHRRYDRHEHVGGALPGPHCYILLVRRSLVRRLATVLIAAVAGFAAPTASFAHGVAHQREHHEEHSAPGHGGTSSHSTATELHAAVPNVIGAAEDAGHSHPQLDSALGVRPHLTSFVLPAEVVVPSLPVLVIRTGAPVPHEALPRADPSGEAPPKLRAPPLR